MTDVVTIRTSQLTIEGRSRAGNETWFRVKELNVALDIGRCPDRLIGVPNVFVTHPHLDHALGIPFYASQRNLQRLPTGTVFVPAEKAEEVRELMRLHERLEGTSYDLDIRGMAIGESLGLRRKLVVEAHESTHRVPARSWRFLERRQKLLADLAGSSPQQLAAERAGGKPTVEERLHPLLLYTGDTDAGIFECGTPLYDADVLMIECSFTGDADGERAKRYTHLHLDEIFERADLFENEMIILTHFSLRDAPVTIHERVRRRLPRVLRGRVRLALPDPHSIVDG
jgi:ribonuclease Z